jgi:hypothetical protein
MLNIKPTKNLIGISIQGDYLDLSELLVLNGLVKKSAVNKLEIF